MIAHITLMHAADVLKPVSGKSPCWRVEH